MLPLCVAWLAWSNSQDIPSLSETKVSHLFTPNLGLLSPLPCVHAFFFCLSFISLLDSCSRLLVFSSKQYLQVTHNLLKLNSNTCSLCLTSVPSLMVLFDLKGVASSTRFFKWSDSVWNLNKLIPENHFYFPLHSETYLRPDHFVNRNRPSTELVSA